MSGRRRGDTTPFFSCAPVVTIEIGVTSGTGAGGGGRQQQRQARPLGDADAVDVREGFAAREEQRHEFRDIERGAAPQSDHRVGVEGPGAGDRVEDNRLRRIRHDPVEHLGGDALPTQGLERRRRQPGPDEPRIGDDEDPRPEPRGRDRRRSARSCRTRRRWTAWC